MARRALLALAVVAGCSTGEKAASHVDSTAGSVAASDCIGPGIPQIDLGHVGQLRLDLPLRDIARLCPNIHDSIARGDESIDTAIVISRPGLTVVGRIALIEGDEGRRPYHVDSMATIPTWTVYGKDALLPKGVPLSALGDSLVAAFGKPVDDHLNGDIYVWFCATPGFVFHFDDRPYLEARHFPTDSVPFRWQSTPAHTVDLRRTNAVEPEGMCRG